MAANNITPERLAWVRLARTEGLGPVTVRRLVSRYGSAEKALDAVPVLSARGGRVKELAKIDSVHKELEIMHKRGVQFLCPADPDYPDLLSHIADPPLVLSYRGQSSWLRKDTMVGIVGARNASVNAMRLAQKWAGEIGASGGVIVSGLARGIDTAAHQGGLKTGTVAVLAGGLDNVYPTENQKLADQIADQGCIVSEEPLTLAPMASHFPKRNRIISGLSRGVVVIEATLKSGSLITARLAAEQGREVMAVPGFPADPRAAGPNALIRDGAALVQNAQDVLEAVAMFKPRDLFTALEERAPTDALFDEGFDTGDLRARILEALSMMPISLDDLAGCIGCSPQNLSLPLLELELSGLIRYGSQNKIALGNIESSE